MRQNKTMVSTDVPGYFLNRKTGFIVNMNSSEKEMYKQAIHKNKEQKAIQNELTELRELVKKLMEKNV